MTHDILPSLNQSENTPEALIHKAAEYLVDAVSEGANMVQIEDTLNQDLAASDLQVEVTAADEATVDEAWTRAERRAQILEEQRLVTRFGSKRLVQRMKEYRRLSERSEPKQN